jgi:hypothetical protein
MGTKFANAPVVPTVVEVQVMPIYFDATCRYCRRPATTNIRPVDGIGRPTAGPRVYAGYTGQLVQRAARGSTGVLPGARI